MISDYKYYRIADVVVAIKDSTRYTWTGAKGRPNGGWRKKRGEGEYVVRYAHRYRRCEISALEIVVLGIPSPDIRANKKR